ncbi:hypothetical protein C8R48DRAFT_818724 [Suillus tomentosus]|nr:hypothetical protein C8R48DRAFT_818724 [Suillus tomentosus]
MAHYADYPMGHIPVSTSTSCFQSAPFSPSALSAPSAPLSPSAHFLPSDYNHMLAQFSDIFDPIENSSAPSEIEVGVTQEMADDIEVVEALTSRERLSVVPEVYLSAPQSPADSSVNLYSPMNSLPESWMVSSAVDVSSVQLDDDTPEPKAPEAPPPFTDTLHMILLVVSHDGITVITTDDMLMLATKWIAGFNSDLKRVAKLAIMDTRSAFGFGLNDTSAADPSLLANKCVELLRRFMAPQSTLLPISVNGLLWLLQNEIVKSLVFYIIFRASSTSGARVVIGDEESAIFRTAPLPPVAMIAYVLAIWYSALLTRLSELVKAMKTSGLPVNIMMSIFPPVAFIYSETDDPAYPDFLQVFANFCNIDLRIQTFDHCRSHCGDAGCANERLFSASFTPSTRHFLEIEHTEHALKSWLQNQGREVASDPLFATTSVLFGWVDPLDLIAVLQVSLRVTAIERQLLKEHNTIITFLMRGGRSLMEERMYRAQMEVSLFSKAIANLCEELKARYCPPTWSKTQLVQKTDEDLVTSQFELSSATREKCEAWLATSWQFEVDFPQSHEVPELYEHLSRHDNDFLSPLMEAWFGRVTHRTYITTSSADSKFLHTDNIKSFKAKKNKTPDALKSDFSILELKKQRVQAEVDMFSEAIARTAGIQCTDDGTYTSSGTAGTFESRLPANSSKLFDYWFEDCSSPYALSIIAIKMYLKVRVHTSTDGLCRRKGKARDDGYTGILRPHLQCRLAKLKLMWKPRQAADWSITYRQKCHPHTFLEDPVAHSPFSASASSFFNCCAAKPGWRILSRCCCNGYSVPLDQVGLNRLNHLQTTLSTLHTISDPVLAAGALTLHSSAFIRSTDCPGRWSVSKCPIRLNPVWRRKAACYLSTEVEKVGSAPVSGGSFADVWKGIWANSHNGTQPVELKYLRQYMHMTDEIKEKLMLRLKSEVAAWHHLRHSNIAQLYSVDQSPNPIAMVSPWSMKWIQKQINLHYFGSQLFAQLPASCYHRDLKSSNILTGDNGQALLTDFGLSNVIEKVLESELSMRNSHFATSLFTDSTH